MQTERRTQMVGLVLALGLFAAACGDDPPTPTTGEKVEELAEHEFAIGTKGFTEHFILAEMTRHLLEDAGASVEIRDLPATAQVRQALEGGDIQLYWEYTGTGWTNFLGHDTVDTDLDPRDLYEQVAADDLEENGVRWLEPAGFNNTYTIVVRREAAEDFGITTLSELAAFKEEREQDMTFCIDTTFGERDDGLPAIERTYGIDWPRDLVTVMDYAVVFASVAEGRPCNFGEVYATEPRIEELDLVVIADEENAFVSYLPAITMLDSLYQEVGAQVEELIAPILELLDEETITALNARVDLEGEFAEDVARDWLAENGLLD